MKNDELRISRDELSALLKEELSSKLEELIGSSAYNMNLSYDLYNVDVVDMVMYGKLYNSDIKEQSFKNFVLGDNTEIEIQPSTSSGIDISVNSNYIYGDMEYKNLINAIEKWYNNICDELLKTGLELVDFYTSDRYNKTIDKFLTAI